MSQITLSIVVPTRNRAACLRSMLETLEHYHSAGHRFQVVIADNSDDDALRARCAQSPLDLNYLYSSDTLSVVENFNRAVPLIRGQYVCFIGDDDLITSRIFEVVDVLREQRCEAAVIADAVRCIYFWPGIVHPRWGDVGGNLFISRATGRVSQVNARAALRRARLRISEGPQLLPRAYLGVVSMAAVKRVIERHGELFGGISPDIFSSRLLADVVERTLAFDFPFVAPGAGPSSTSAARAQRTDIGGLRNNDHTGRFKSLDWSKLTPSFYSPFTVWAQSLIAAERLLDEVPSVYGFAYLHARCLLFARGHGVEVRKAIAQHPRPAVLTVATASFIPAVAIEYFLSKIPVLVRQAPGGAQDKFSELSSSDAAVRKLETHLSNVAFRRVN